MAEFTHNTVSYRLIPTTEWTWADATFAKEASRGMSVAEIERGVMDLDPDACIAVIAVSVRRVRTDATAARLRTEIENGGGSLVAWFEEIGRDEVGNAEGAVDGPPAEGAEAPEEPATP